jgi:excisionase family DNA binding protein
MRGTYSVAEAAQLIGCGRRQAYAAVKAGELPSIRVGSRYYVPRAALHRLLGITPDMSEDPGSAQALTNGFGVTTPGSATTYDGRTPRHADDNRLHAI